MADILVIEPFFGGSHAQLIKVLSADDTIRTKIQLHTLPAKKWHWRARASALHFMKSVPPSTSYRVLFSSSVLNLAELVALRPDLAGLWKVVYFHENQLVYPVRKHQDRDFHYGYCQITTCLVADAIVFNSEFNKESFLKAISSHLKLMPDYRPKDLEATIRPKCRVIYFPVDFYAFRENDIPTENDLTEPYDVDANTNNKTLNVSSGNSTPPVNHICDETGAQQFEQKGGNHTHVQSANRNAADVVQPETRGIVQTVSRHDSCLHIVWPHRWEHDKDPDTFFQALFRLQDEGCDFKVSVLGESYQEVPEIFDIAKKRLGSRVVAWGFQDRDDYRAILENAHVVVSTANHEFFGVSMLEATSRGCYPLCPKRLVYPEIYPDECLYSTQTQLVKRLKNFCGRPDKIRAPKINLERFSWNTLKKDFYEVLKCDI